MDIKFCDKCENFMNFCIDKDKNPIYKCTRCDNITEYDYQHDSKGIQFNKNIEQKNILNSNKYLTMDPTLPIITNNNIKCINKECISIKNKDVSNEICYIKYDETNIYFMYICKHCDQKWTNDI
jgi:hypothetical protein